VPKGCRFSGWFPAHHWLVRSLYSATSRFPGLTGLLGLSPINKKDFETTPSQSMRRWYTRTDVYTYVYVYVYVYVYIYVCVYICIYIYIHIYICTVMYIYNTYITLYYNYMRWYSMKETISDDVPLPCLIHLWWSQETVHTQLSAPPSVVTSNLAPSAKCGSRGDTGGNGGNFPSYNQLYINSRFQYVRINLGYSIVLNRHQPT